MLRQLRTLLAALAFVVLLTESASARAETKGASSTAPPTTSQNQADKEDEAPDSPRTSMRTFLDLAEHGRWQEASAYLDLPRGSERRAVELTAELYAVLSQKLAINPEALSPLAHGRQTDGLPNGIEELGRIQDAKDRVVSIRLVRREPRNAEDEARWVFSQSTVAAVPGLYAALRDRWMRAHLPASLLAYGPFSLAWWQWIALPLLGALCLAVGQMLAFGTALVARRLLARRAWSEGVLKRLRPSLTVGWAIGLFALATPFLALTVRGEDIVERILRALGYLTFFWALLRVVSTIGDEVVHSEWARTRPSAHSLSSVGVSLGRVIVAVLALMFTFSELGFPVTSIVAGLGIGGVALALAAQKTVENLFGSISILVDQPFRIGDTIRVDTVEGVVESMGVRSTRVRTADRTVVIFPNGKLADMRIESLGPRDRMRFAVKLQIARTVSIDRLGALSSQLRERLEAEKVVRKEDLSVRLAAIGEASFDLDVTASVETIDALEFAKVRESLLLLCIETVEKADAKLAVPVRQLLEPDASSAS